MASEMLDRTVGLGGYIGSSAHPLNQKENGLSSEDSPDHLHEKHPEHIYSYAHDEIETDSKDNIDKKFDGTVEITEESSDNEAPIDGFVADPFVPFDDLPDENRNILTIRAAVVGIACGALVNASNIYLGLKSGWTFSANIFGTIVGFAVIKSMSTYLNHIPIIGGDFGPRENNIVQTFATAAGGMSSVFISAFPALYQLKLLDTPAHDYWRIVAITAVGGYFGFAFATPLRKFFIIYVARELRLIFPTPSATAVTIRSMHLAAGGEALAKLKMRALSGAFAGAFVLRVVSQYAIGILWDWHVATWLLIWGGYHNQAIQIENWGWLIEWTPAFIGSGMLVGLNVAISFFAGTVFSWGVIGPSLVATGAAFGKHPITNTSDLYPHWHGYVNYFSLSGTAASKDTPSPRYWLLWPGVLAMLTISMVELACQWRVFWFASKAITRGLAKASSDMMARTGRTNTYLAEKGRQDESHLVKDSASEDEQVKLWMWVPGLIAIIVLACVVMGTLYGMPVGESLLALFLAFFFSFMAIQCTGATDITPLTAASKSSQIILGGATKGEHWGIERAQRLNLLGGALASIGANQSADLVGDFRVGFLLRTPPKIQWLAQAIGTLCAVFFAPALFVLFSKAYPCILDKDAAKCPFSVPSVAAWRAVTVAMTEPDFPVPRSSGIFAICWAVFGAAMVLIRHNLWVGERAWVRKYHPNMMVFSLAMVIPQTVYGTATLMGAFLAFFWAKKSQRTFDIYGYAVAAGLIAGEGIGGVVNAIFQVAGISGDVYGTNIACPLDSC